MLGEGTPDHVRPSVARALKVGAFWLAMWLVPVAAILIAFGEANTFSQIALFFSKMAMVTFGGAYAVLAYVAQTAVEHYHWLGPREMLDGLGMAETTPGPLIMVLQFVGFMAAFRDPGTLSPMLAGTLGGLLATWVTFAPCFLWIFLGAPFIEKLRGNKGLAGALSAITAAVVGVILNLSIWFALHTVFLKTTPMRSFGLSFDLPVWSSLDLAALLLAIAAATAIFRFNVGMLTVLADRAPRAWRCGWRGLSDRSERHCDQLFGQSPAADREYDKLLVASHVGHGRAGRIGRQFDAGQLFAGRLVVDPQMRIDILHVAQRQIEAGNEARRTDEADLHDDHDCFRQQRPTPRMASQNPARCSSRATRRQRDAAADRNAPAMLAGVHVDGDDAAERRLQQRQPARTAAARSARGQ